MDRSDADYIAAAYSGQSGVAATQAEMDALTVLYRELATELVAVVPPGKYLTNALRDLENSAKQAFYGMSHPGLQDLEESV
jgi:hypothetical protein